MAQAKKKQETNRLVTVLFAVGAIGWLFFAYDRLTESKNPPRTQAPTKLAKSSDNSWKRDLKDWLIEKLSETDRRDSGPKSSRMSNIPRSAELPILPEPEALKEERSSNGESLVRSEIPELTREIEGNATSMPFYFFRLDQKGLPRLTKLVRQVDSGRANQIDLLKQLVAGPTSREQENDFIDSFVSKPKVLSATVEDQCAILNFNEKFGAGVSFQTLKFQLRQLYKNVESWYKVDCMKIRIKGKSVSTLGSDGLMIPSVITASWIAAN